MASGLARVAANSINYRLAKHHFPINMAVFQQNRERLVERLKTDANINDGLILLEGGKDMPMHATDKHSFFRQESFFHWALGLQK
jgi:hypothetical protein